MAPPLPAGKKFSNLMLGSLRLRPVEQQAADEGGLDTAEPLADPLRSSKLLTLVSIMRHRGQPAHPDFVAALNGVDVVFMNDGDVRAAYSAFLDVQGQGAELVKERLFDLIAMMVLNLGVADRITAADIERRYEPAQGKSRLKSVLEDAERRWGVAADSTLAA
jgi:hypothetical protein